MKNVMIRRPLTLLLAAPLAVLGSCGLLSSSDESAAEALSVAQPEEAPEEAPEVAALEQQVAEMQAALESQPEPAVELDEAEALEPADEFAGVFFDPGEAFPVEVIDGVPVQMALDLAEPEPEPEQAADELAPAEPLEAEPLMDPETVPESEPAMQPKMEPAMPDELAAELEQPVDAEPVALAAAEEPGEDTQADQADAEIAESELSAEELDAMQVAMAPEALGDPGLIPEPVEPVVEPVAEAVIEPEVEPEIEPASELAAAVEPEFVAPSMEQILAELMAEGPQAGPLEQPPVLGDLSDDPGVEADPEALLAENEIEDSEAPGPLAAETVSDEPSEAVEASPAELLEPASELAMDPAMLPEAEADAVPDVAVETAPEAPDELVWSRVEVPSELAMQSASEASPAEPGQLQPRSEATAVAEGEQPETLEIQAVEEPPVATALDSSASFGLPSSLAFTAALEPSQRLLLGPLCLVDPSGGLARLSVGLMDTAEAASTATASPPEDPALAGLTRSDGSEFEPVPIDESQLTDEPGLGMIWWSSDVPSEHVASKVEVQTPSVGRVRVVLNSGDYVEGVMHSVGMGQYWIDGDLGRFAVRSGLVSHIEHLPKPGLGQQTEGLQAGDLVRAKAKSGFIEGRLISMKDGVALIETVGGMRINLPDAEVEPLGESKTRVVID